jgi:type VI secretion system protein
MKHWLLIAGNICLIACLSACGAAIHLPDHSSTTELKQINVVAQVDANLRMATALDVVFVYDRNVPAVLPKTGPEWFANKDALLASLASGVAVMSLQVPPGSSISNEPLPKGFKNAIAVYSYANYLSADGQVMGNITSFKCVLMTLSSTKISYSHCR